MKRKGPQFLQFVIPVVSVLKENGGSGNASEVIDKVVEKLKIPESKVSETLASGGSRVRNRVQWARFYLVKAGYLEASERGTWKLTQDGYEAELTEGSVYELFKTIHKKFEVAGNKRKNTADQDDEVVEDETHAVQLINTLKSMKAPAFERVCKRLLTEIGIHDIVITGKSGDMGIDGVGLIKINDVVNFNIVFQCKKHQDVVNPHHVRDFRGSMQGRADKGLILTTGRFTAAARKEASRDGVPPIELIDGERLVTLFEKYSLGLKPVVKYELVPEFFENFKS